MFQHRYLLRSASFALFAVTAFAFQAKPPGAAASPARELTAKYCVSCHNDKLKTAGLALDRIDPDHPSNSPDNWEKVIVKLRSRAMPPPGLPRPDNAAYEQA